MSFRDNSSSLASLGMTALVIPSTTLYVRGICFKKLRASLQLQMDGLFLRERQHLVDALLTPESRLLDAAERRAEKVPADFVDPHVAGLDRRRGAIRGGQIVRPYRARQSVFDAVHVRKHRRLVGPA